jgi:hypothetical protein
MFRSEFRQMVAPELSAERVPGELLQRATRQVQPKKKHRSPQADRKESPLSSKLKPSVHG